MKLDQVQRKNNPLTTAGIGYGQVQYVNMLNQTAMYQFGFNGLESGTPYNGTLSISILYTFNQWSIPGLYEVVVMELRGT